MRISQKLFYLKSSEFCWLPPRSACWGECLNFSFLSRNTDSSDIKIPGGFGCWHSARHPMQRIGVGLILTHYGNSHLNQPEVFSFLGFYFCERLPARGGISLRNLTIWIDLDLIIGMVLCLNEDRNIIAAVDIR